MATGRTVASRFDRVYMDGLDISAYTASPAGLGPLAWEYPEADVTALSDAAHGALPGVPMVNPGTLNGIFDNTATTGLHALASGVAAARLVTLARGIRAAPALGDPCFTAYTTQLTYTATESGGAAFVNIDFAKELNQPNLMRFSKPWGHLLHPSGAETAVNTATGADDYGASTALGSWFWFHCWAGNGTVTIKAQDAAVNSNGSFADVTGLTSGVVTASSTPIFGQVASAAGATLRQYTRWQIVLGTATTVTFVCGVVRITQLGQ